MMCEHVRAVWGLGQHASPELLAGDLGLLPNQVRAVLGRAPGTELDDGGPDLRFPQIDDLRLRVGLWAALKRLNRLRGGASGSDE